tara:strand:+ start:370 stop:633 length:264 start_codon:yes stop_codon:yes gene_type:complete
LYNKYIKAAAVVTHNSTVLSGFTGSGWDGIYIGVTGDVTMQLQGDASSVLFKNMVQGTVYPIAPQIIAATGTDATNIVVLESGGTYS